MEDHRSLYIEFEWLGSCSTQSSERKEGEVSVELNERGKAKRERTQAPVGSEKQSQLLVDDVPS